MGPYHGAANPKHDLAYLATLCHKGDLVNLEALLRSENAEERFAGDVNSHVTDMTPLMFAAQNGQTEVVEMLLEANADPHMRCRVPFGQDGRDGESAKSIAAKQGWDDIVAILAQAEASSEPKKYKRYGRNNNLVLHDYKTGETGAGRDALAAMKRDDYVAGEVAALPAQSAPILPQSSVVLLFPGQGSQYVGMLKNLKDNPEVKNLVAIANKVLGYDILEIMLNGPEARLEDTSVCQPALFLASMAGMVKLRQDNPDAADKPGALAGLSLGEYSALCVAGVFSFEDGMRLVKTRGEAMSAAAKTQPQAMLSVAGLDQNVLEELCAAEARGGEVCQVANVLFPQGFACSGTKKAIDGLLKAAQDKGALQAKLLKTSGAFHTKLMDPAKERLVEALNDLLPKMKPPRFDVYLNVTGKRIRAGTAPAEIVPLLGRQLVSPVLWFPSVKLMIKDGMSEFHEVGPMKQLKAMMKRIDPSMWSSTSNVEV